MTFDANGGEGGKTVTQNYGTALSAPTVTRTGYTFNGWSPSVPATMPAGNATYVAQWKINQYTVKFDANGGEGGKTVTQNYGTELSAPTVARTGYTFNGWSPSVPATMPAGNVTRTVTRGAAVGALPVPMRKGYELVGWFTAASGGAQITASTVVTGNVTYYAQWMAYGGKIKDVSFAKAQTVDGVLYRNGAFVGTVQLKAGKISKKKGTVSISATATLLDGKKITGKAVTVKKGDDGTLSGTVKFKAPIGDMHFEMDADGTFTFDNGGYSMTEGAVGGNLPNGTVAFRVNIDSFPGLPAGYEVLEDVLPFEVIGKVSGGKKIDFGKAASVKYAKVKEGKTTRYVLSGLNDEKKPNVPALKLTYTPKTGVFKGSFKIYATNEASISRSTPRTRRA